MNRLALVTILVCLIYGAAGAAVGHADETIFDPGATGYAQPEDTLSRIQALGADTIRVRVDYAWDGWTYDQLDTLVAGAQARGFNVLMAPTNYDPDRTAEAVGGLARRYPTVRQWSIWNEPDLFRFTEFPRGYRVVVQRALRALIASGRSRSQILVGETSPLVTPAWLRAFGRVPRGVRGWAHHPYVLPRAMPLRLLHRIVGLPIFNTEFGAFTSYGGSAFDGRQSPGVIRRVSCRAERTPWIRSFAQYLLTDDGFGTGLFDQASAPTAALAAYQGRCQ